MTWTPAQLREMAAEKKRHGGSNRRAAEALAAKWGVSLTPSALKCAVGRADLPDVDETRSPDPCTEPVRQVEPDLRARIAELEAQLSSIHVEEGSAAPGKDLTVALLFDLHYPEHDRPAWAAFLRWARDTQPDEVIISEFAEWLSASQHGNSAWGSRWTQEKADVKRALVQLRSVVPSARILWQESNHDTRLTRILEDRLPAFAGALTIPNELGLAEMGVEWVNERTVLRRGALKIIHGHQIESGFRGALPKYHAARAVQLYGERGCIVVYGHVHREQWWCEPCDGGEKRARAIGCMRTLVPAWHRARESGWHHQFAVGYVSASGATNLYPVDVIRGSFAFGGRRWAA